MKEQTKRIFALLAIWIAIAISFGVLYSLLPGNLIHTNSRETVTSLWDAIYFSFITILTIGYGDISPIGFIRILTAAEGVIGWILFGIIVYRVVSFKQDLILNEIHNFSNEQYSNKIRNSLFISNTNLTRFIKNVKERKIPQKSVIYELDIISTTLTLNIEDTKNYLCRRNSLVNEEESSMLIKIINLCSTNFITAVNLLGKMREKDSILKENINKIVLLEKEIYAKYSCVSSDRQIEELKNFFMKLETFTNNL